MSCRGMVWAAGGRQVRARVRSRKLSVFGAPCKIEGSRERSQLGKISWHAVLFIGGM